MKHISRYLRRKWPFLLLFLLGLYAAGSALLALARTAIYVHEAVILPGEVVDVRQFPFETPWDALSRGNLSWAGETAYQPIVRFVLPDGIIITRTMPDADNVDYLCGQTVEVITHPHDPNQAHLHKWKFQWGGSCILLTTGLLMAGGGWLILRRPLTPPGSSRHPRTSHSSRTSRDSRASQTPRSPRAPGSSRAPQAAHDSQPPRTTPTPQEPRTPQAPQAPRAPRASRPDRSTDTPPAEDLVLEALPPEKPRKRASRQKKSTEKTSDGTTAPKSRRNSSSKKKTSSTEEPKSDAPRKPRRRRKTTTA